MPLIKLNIYCWGTCVFSLPRNKHLIKIIMEENKNGRNVMPPFHQKPCHRKSILLQKHPRIQGCPTTITWNSIRKELCIHCFPDTTCICNPQTWSQFIIMISVLVISAVSLVWKQMSKIILHYVSHANASFKDELHAIINPLTACMNDTYGTSRA